jgi:type IV pilus assembly protein PilC
MAVFTWEAVSKEGEVKKGEREAPNQAAVMSWMREQQMRPRKIQAKGQAGKKPSGSRGPGGGKGASKKVPTKEIVIFARQFATMIDAGLPLVQCLEILAGQQAHIGFKKILYEIKADVESGSNFADSLRRHPKVFDTLFTSLVQAGEIGGILDTIFQRIAAYLEKADRLKKKVKGAMTYPGIIMMVAIIVVTVLLVVVIPVFENMFKEFGGELPPLTQMVITFSKNSKTFLPVAAILIVVLVVAFKAVYATPKGRLFFDTAFLKMPVIGPLIRKVAVARFTRTLATMISSGVPILDGLDIVSRTAGNKVIENAILKTKQRISEGKTISEPLMETGVFPNMVCQMIAVGEATGAMDAMLAKIADFYDEEVDVAVDALTSLMEPTLMVFLGVVIGGLVIAMYLPVFKLAGSISGASK